MVREGVDGEELYGGGEEEVISWYTPNLPLPKKLAADLRAKVRVEPGKVV